MNKIFQRIFSAFVVVAITISLFPALKVSASSSGTLSSGVTWEQNGKILKIYPNDSGEGSIDDEAFRLNNSFDVVIINDGITNIGNQAFDDSNLTFIYIPNSVTTIGNCAFRNSPLEAITLSKNITTFGIDIFSGCRDLKSVIMDESAYDPDLFHYCDISDIDFRFYRNLTVNCGSFVINESVDDVFYGCRVDITADVPEGKEFVKWEVNSGSADLDDATSATTTFTMPDEDVEITAVYKDITKTVTFDSNGHGTAPAEQTVTYGEKATKPSDLTETGYTFGGWYTDSDCTSAYEFDTAVKSDFTLYAKWTAESSNSGSVKPVANTYTVVTGGDGTWDGVSDYVVRVKSDDDDEHCIDRFLWAAVDGHELEVGKEAEITRGSTIVTIKSDYLKTLSAGTHNIVVNFTDNSITTTLTISNAPATNSGSSLPSTGEMQSPAMYVGLAMIVAAGALSVLVIRKRKEA